MDTIERKNLCHIESLNQRGGRTLSIVDLILANTISCDAAAHVGDAIGRGASYLTAAVPGGAGKTSVLAALLAFLPEGMPIQMIMTPADLAASQAISEPRCCIAHEIGAAGIPGYLWGAEVARYLALAMRPHMVVSCLHADTIEDLTRILTHPPLSVTDESLAAIRFKLFIQVEILDQSQRSVRRRLAAIHDSGSNGTGPGTWWRDDRDDCLIPTHLGMLNEDAQRLSCLLQELAAREIVEFHAVRRAILEHRRQIQAEK